MKISDVHPELRVYARLFHSIVLNMRKAKAAKAFFSLLKLRHTRKLRFEQKYITRADGSKLRLCVYLPKKPRENVPGLLWIHGGGYAFGVPERDESYIKRFIHKSGCVVVSPDYTLSLVKPYPAAFNDCYDALLWLKEHGAEYGMRSDQIFVGGDSAGGGLAAAVSLRARDSKDAAIAFQMPLYPMLDDRPTASSRCNTAPMWNTASNELAWRLYLGALYKTDGVPAYAAPARAVSYKKIPPTCTFVGSIEPFYDETEEYVKNLRDSGVITHFRVFEGCFHAFNTICPKTNIAKEANAFLMETFEYAAAHYFAKQP